ncbi:MAG: hypothetical protein WKF85_10195 [Chitinophagaceae bacterium]
MKKINYQLFLIFLVLYCQVVAGQQKNKLSIGFNATHFKDWRKGQFLNFFNPEISYSKNLNNKFRISSSLNAFYGEATNLKEVKEGTVTYRLIFSNDYTLDYIKNNFFVGVGPTLRYRKERTIKYFYPQPNPFERVYGPSPAKVDYGGVLKTGYNVGTTSKGFLSFILSYRFYNQGINPVSFGAFYGFSW